MSPSSAAKANGIDTMQTVAAIQVTENRRIQTIMYLFPAKVTNEMQKDSISELPNPSLMPIRWNKLLHDRRLQDIWWQQALRQHEIMKRLLVEVIA